MDGARAASARTGMLVFLASDAFAFAGLLFVFAYLRVAGGSSGGGPAPPLVAGIGLTAILLLSSATLFGAARTGGRRRLLLLGATAALGALFLGAQALEWIHLGGEGFLLGRSHHASAFYVLTGYHGLHVAAGVVALAALALRGRRVGRPAIEAASLYWHFVDVVWLFLFAALYVI